MTDRRATNTEQANLSVDSFASVGKVPGLNVHRDTDCSGRILLTVLA